MLSNYSTGAARKKVIFILGALLAVNAAVAHIVTGQIADAKDYQVKDEQVVVEEATSVSSENEPAKEHADAPAISVYTVKTGDTISSIAQKFGIKQNTLLWANEMTVKSTLKVGQSLVILPINGIQYTVKKNDTISGIAKKFKADEEEILYFNDLENAAAIQPGVELIIPDAEPTPAKTAPAAKPAVKEVKKTTQATVKAPNPVSAFSEKDTHEHGANETKEEKEDSKPSTASGSYGIFIAPVIGSVLSQGYHAVNAVDFAAPVGTTVRAAAAGTVIVAKSGCSTGSMKNNCNGGFGNFIVVSHDNGVQTLYAHLSKISVSVGESVNQGETIGLVGNTGRSSGAHLHFETHGLKNPFTKDKKGTRY